ncbi:MAG: UDP-N-acetylmuramoyl-tripeptide--D-alanyl-D-alanine ligase [Bifidobacteriaceae bacterium]|jgi:UDP-N-acetylmuramoyl-tripeptide--D-alanyl-D-alanine ligase|nr:UDP-N-acetylmuramoyl-tripeptide--D-alanyl-D-alanine ligase [Bifidobacteriaceae bacterium]
MDMTAGQVAAITGGHLELGGPAGSEPAGPGAVNSETPVTSCTLDSRQAGPGALFVAVAGERADGHDYAQAAYEAGAALVLASRPVAVPHVLVPDTLAGLGLLARAHLQSLRKNLKVIAVTGSVGKTTTKDLLGRLGRALGPTVAARGSFNNDIGLPLTVLQASPATRVLVLEMGANHVGEIAHLCWIAPPDVGVVLGVAPAHIGEFGSIEAIAAAKSELPAALGPDATAVLAADDPRVATMPTTAHLMTFGASPAARVRLKQSWLDDAGRLTCRILTPQGEVEIASGLIGLHHGVNLLASVAGGLALGIDLAAICQALAGAGADSPHRMALTDLPGGLELLDDAYNSNPASADSAMRFLAARAKATGRRSWAVLGEMLELGSASEGAHRQLGVLAAELGLDRLTVVGTGAKPALSGALDTGMDPRAVQFCEAPPRPSDIREAEATETIILIKGSNGTGLWRLAESLANPEAAPC